MTNLLGQSLGRYHILEQLGEGGMATVYKAFDTRLECDVAVKVIRIDQFSPAALERVLQRFEREAKALAKLSHPNIVGVIDYGEYEGVPYLVMEYLPGGTLKERLGQPMPWTEAVRLLLPIARGLAYAHQRGVAHRDVKPSNILIGDSGEPMLTDFGIAKILEGGDVQTLTGTGIGVGTPEYMAPEQWTGQTSPQSDQYALGVVFYEMLTGRKPYTADTPAAILLKQATEPLPRPSQYARDLPEKVEKLLLKALAKNPADRYANMGDFATALEAMPSGVAAPARLQPARPRERTLDTQATINQMEGPTIKEPPAPRAPSTQTVAPSSSSGLLRYWPIGVVGVLIIVGLSIALIIALAPGLGRGTPSAPTEAPIATGSPTEAPTETPAEEITDAKGVIMRLVPAGPFTMGGSADTALSECQKLYIGGTCDRGWFTDEEPAQTVYLDAFYMDKYEVPNKLYKACENAGVCKPPTDSSSYTRSSYYGNS